MTILVEEKPIIAPQKKRKLELPFALGSTPFVWQIIFFYIPIILMSVTSLFKISSIGTIEGLTLEHFHEVLSPVYFSVIGNSIALALGAAFFCLAIAFPVAHFMATRGKKYKNILLFFLIIPFWTNFLLHVCAWYFVLEREGFLNMILMKIGLISTPLHFLNSPFSMMLMMIYYFLPFMILPIYASLDRFNYDLIEASRDLGANSFQTFSRVLLPVTLPAIRAGFFLVFIPAFGEFVIPELMGGDKYYFVGNVISQYILGQSTGPLGAAFTVLASASLIFCGLLC
ncbi:MAG: ABC transporter permease, partial [Simkaniaceae bacterium]|nr:ABC transporter permease [Simkaniaceae bacterium]